MIEVRRAVSDDWRPRLEHGHCVLAWAGGRPVGCVSGFAEDRLPDEHHLVAMWVEPAHRRTTGLRPPLPSNPGIGEELLRRELHTT